MTEYLPVPHLDTRGHCRTSVEAAEDQKQKAQRGLCVKAGIWQTLRLNVAITRRDEEENHSLRDASVPLAFPVQSEQGFRLSFLWCLGSATGKHVPRGAVILRRRVEFPSRRRRTLENILF